ncbi:MmcQ/YjbR family DNA-binding protein [Nocardioides sp. zg-DK7169]|uniref:MmcQ/YjbR family DNA-binding protein n=1 Tax=Nocardioides sp. zg-DK7169 TaxID=2736600 RepID=UPI00155735B2|nr:MmcQ/YjbR family DNA-binding protein [Nocardioides sp. zg-DK7169]NPC96228.1 hypothetical protein [Nocardioides sp. zg-DK7169]
MDVETMTARALAFPGAWADNPWDHEHPVVKVGPGERGKIFAFLRTGAVGVKSARTREEADEWLHRYPRDVAVMAHIGRWGWNDLGFGGAIPDDELVAALEESYRLVVAGLPVRLRPDGWEDPGRASAVRTPGG